VRAKMPRSEDDDELMLLLCLSIPDEIEFLAIYAKYMFLRGFHPRVPTPTHISFSLDNYEDAEFIHKFRFSKHEAQQLHHLLVFPDSI
jgi:hypothetical protein